MAKHRIHLNTDFLAKTVNVLLVRDPVDVCHSFKLPVTLEEMGYADLVWLFSKLRS